MSPFSKTQDCYFTEPVPFWMRAPETGRGRCSHSIPTALGPSGCPFVWMSVYQHAGCDYLLWADHLALSVPAGYHSQETDCLYRTTWTSQTSKQPPYFSFIFHYVILRPQQKNQPNGQQKNLNIVWFSERRFQRAGSL